MQGCWSLQSIPVFRVLLDISLQFLSEFEAFVPEHLLELFGRSEGMLVDEFAIIVGERIFFAPSIVECPIEIGILETINVYGFGWVSLWGCVRHLNLLK